MLSDPLSNFLEVTVDCIAVESGDFSNLRGVQIDREELDKLSKFPLRKFRTFCILVFPRHDYF